MANSKKTANKSGDQNRPTVQFTIDGLIIWIADISLPLTAWIIFVLNSEGVVSAIVGTPTTINNWIQFGAIVSAFILWAITVAKYCFKEVGINEVGTSFFKGSRLLVSLNGNERPALFDYLGLPYRGFLFTITYRVDPIEVKFIDHTFDVMTANREMADQFLDPDDKVAFEAKELHADGPAIIHILILGWIDDHWLMIRSTGGNMVDATQFIKTAAENFARSRASRYTTTAMLIDPVYGERLVKEPLALDIQQRLENHATERGSRSFGIRTGNPTISAKIPEDIMAGLKKVNLAKIEQQEMAEKKISAETVANTKKSVGEIEAVLDLFKTQQINKGLVDRVEQQITMIQKMKENPDMAAEFFKMEYMEKILEKLKGNINILSGAGDNQGATVLKLLMQTLLANQPNQPKTQSTI